MGNNKRTSRNDRMDPNGAKANRPTTTSSGNEPYTPSDLPIDDEGRIYHLQVKPGQIAPDILLVGDPGRAEFIGSTFLYDLELEHEHRGLVTVTGTSEISGEPTTIISPLKTTVATSGIGTPSLEIVANELVALNEIDFKARTRKSGFPRLHVIRVGTSGGLQASTILGTPIITSYAIGLDNTGLYYEADHGDEVCKRLEQEIDGVIGSAMHKQSRFRGKIHPYVSRAEPIIVDALSAAAESLGVPVKRGLTVSTCGFFLPQGRDVSRMSPSIPDLDRIFAEYDPGLEGQRFENMEMESSFLIHFLTGLGYWAGSICPAIANRREETFAHDYQGAIRNAVKIALMALANVRRLYPDSVMS